MRTTYAGLWLITSLSRKSERKVIRDVKVVKIECIKQHRLLICVFDLKERIGQCKVEACDKVQGLETETC